MWNENWDVDVKYTGDDLWLQVCDQDMMSVDIIGETTIKLSSLCFNSFTDDWYEIKYKGKPSGSVHLKGVFSPSTIMNKMATGMQNMLAQQPGFQQYGQPAPQMGYMQPQAQPMMA